MRLAVSACSMAEPGVSRHIKPRKACRGQWVILCAAALITGAAAQEDTPRAKFYRIIDGKVDLRTYTATGAIMRFATTATGRTAWAHRLALRSSTTSPILKPSGVSYTRAKQWSGGHEGLFRRSQRRAIR